MRRFNGIGSKGFTLVEIMIVVAIIALLAAISIPSLLRSRLAANETAAIGTTRTISTACETFRSVQTPPQYPLTLAAMATANPSYIENTFAATNQRQGYAFNYVRTGLNAYTMNANPLPPANSNGTRWFFVDESGVIRVSAVGPATAASTPLQ